MGNALTALLVAMVAGCPCLFDRDQLADEVAARPAVRDAIFGTYPVHAPEYYRARILEIERTEALTPALTDDLAVAWLRIGDPAQAIGLLLEKEAKWPGLFTTAANLSRAYAGAGRLSEAITQAESAVERAEPGAEEGQRLLLAALQHIREAADDPAASTTFLGFDFAGKLGERFRLDPPIDSADTIWRQEVEKRLDIAPELEAYLIDLLRLAGPEQAEAMFVLAELCAARGDRYLAWHAYQRALDLGHPRAVDLPYYQSQVARMVARELSEEFSQLHHYRLRRRAVAWQQAWQRREAEILAAGGDLRADEVWQAFEKEHPKP